MKKIADKLTQLLIRENIIDDSMAEIYQYGFLRILEIGAAVLSGFMICAGMGMIKEGIIFFIFFAALRSYVGGIHLKEYWQCYIASCLLLLLVLLITKYAVIDIHIVGIFIVLGVIGIGIAAAQESRVYAVIVCLVLAVLSAVSIWCFVNRYDSILRLLGCIVILVFGSKLLERMMRIHL